jgi:hypothetical protein
MVRSIGCVFSRCKYYYFLDSVLHTAVQMAGEASDVADAFANHILADQDFVDGLLDEYNDLKDLCRQYIEKVYNKRQGGEDGPHGFGCMVGTQTHCHSCLQHEIAIQTSLNAYRWGLDLANTGICES